MVVSEGAINNIMGGMENTAGVRLHSHRHKLKQRFDIVRKLGQGTYGKVQLALNKETGQEVAIKTIKKAKIETEQDLVRIRREIQIMSSVQHPQIIHIYEVFENREKMVLVMEYAAGGELYDYLSERKVLPEEEARRIFRQVASAVYYCHKHKICHRDLKLENILLDLDGNAKIADFGLSNVFDEKQRLDTFCGSPLYASPEIVKGVPYIGPEVDCWSLGVLLYTLVYGAMPFDGSNFRRLVKQITQGDFYEPSTPATASELIRHMLTVQSTERANVEDICNHWWVNEGYSESCLTLAEALANQTPVRLDLLLSLAPKHISSEHMLIQPDDEDTSQKSDSDRAPPKLKIPPPPALPDGELDAEPLPIRSHSLGAVPPPGGVSVDLLIEKKKREKEKKKKESSTSSSSSKKPPSRPPVEDEKKIRKKEEKPEIEEKRRSVKRESSVEGDRERAKKRDASTDREKSKKRDRSSDREKDKMKKSEEKIKKIVDSPEDINRESSKERQTKEVEKKIVKKRESSLTRKPSTKKKEEAVVSSTPSTSSSAVNKISDAPSEPKKMEAASEVELPKPPSTKSVSKLTEKKKEEKKADDSLQTKDEEKDTDKILKETAAKIEKVESLIMKEEEMMSPVSSPITSPVISPPVTSPLMSPHSSLATSPVRSRTGSESSTEAPRIKSESNSRRQSKIFSKAAMFDPALSAQNSISPPPQDKVKKITRPGALNLSDLTKKFEEKPTNEKKNKVITPFKVSDARKAFESKAEKSLPETPRRKSSNGSGGESETASPKDSLPTSPTKGDKTIANSISKVSPSNRSTNKVNRETSPVKKISKSPTKETSTKDAGRVSPVKREKSPRKEASPTKSVPKTVPKVSSFSKPKEETKERKAEVKPDIVKKEPEVLPISNKTAEREIPITQRGDSSDSSDSESEAEKMLRELSVKREKLEIAKKEKMKKVSEGKEPQSPRDMPAIREEAQNVSVVSPASGVVALQQENKDQKFATLPRGFKAKTELSKPQTPKALENENNLQETDSSSPTTPTERKSFRRLPVVKEVVPIPPEQVLAPTPRSPESERKPRMSSVEEANSGEPVRKKSQVGIILQNRQPTNQYDGKRSSFSEVRSQSPRQEYRTEVQHTIGTPEPRAAPEPQLQRARRERIIPIMLEDDAAGENDIRAMSSRSSVLQPSSSSSSRTSSVSSVPRNSGFGVAPLSSTVTSAASAEGKFNQPSPDSLKKSRRERIIPIAVEGEGLVTPPISESKSSEKVRSFHRQGSSQGSFNRGRGFTLDRAESFSSAGEDDDEEEDGFQILTAESLFSTLLSRVRSLTRKMGGEESGRSSNIGGGMRRGPQPGANSETPSSAGSSGTQSGFWSSLYSPPRDLPVRTIPLSRGHSREGDPFENFAPPLWERSLSRNTSDSDSVFSEPSGPFSTLPRAEFLRHPIHLHHQKLLRDSFFSDFARS